MIRAVFAPLLAFLSVLYSYAMHVRAWFYLVDIFPSDSCGAFVVSIGNVQSGGTGKTPVVAFFARRWRRHLRLGIVSRGYRRKTTGSLRVNTTDVHALSAVERFGDEPTWLATTLSELGEPDVPVQVGEKRVDAARDLAAAEGVKLILLDDGFQHLGLRRSFDIVLIDVSVPGWHWQVLPWGRLRESLSSIKRADAIIFTKTESVDATKLSRIESRISRWVDTTKTPILRFAQSISWPEPITGEPLVIAAGLANPDGFFGLVRSHSSRPKVVDVVRFPDHHAFSVSDVRRLCALARKHGAHRVLVTEKDAVKLRALWSGSESGADSDKVELVVSRLEVRPAREFDEKQLERIDEVILSEVRGAARAGTQLPGRSLTT